MSLDSVRADLAARAPDLAVIVTEASTATVQLAAEVHGVAPGQFSAFRPLGAAPPCRAVLALVSVEVAWARALMQQGAPLVHRLPGRIGWELRLVVQGGLRILDKIEALGFDTFSQRPTVGAADAPLLAWRAVRMRRQSSR